MRTLNLYLTCILVSLLWACEKEEDTPIEEETGNASLVSISDPAILIMDVNGVTTTLQAGGSVSEIISSTVTGGPPPTASDAVFLAGFRNATDTLVRLRIGTLEFTGGTPTNAELQAFLAPGPRTLAELLPGADGLELEWRDASGTWYGTSCGTSPESGSFEITHIASQQIGQDDYVKFRAVFNCTLYACDGSAGSMVVTDGVLVLRVEDAS